MVPLAVALGLVALAAGPAAGVRLPAQITVVEAARPALPECSKPRPRANAADAGGSLEQLLNEYEVRGAAAIEAAASSERAFDRLRSELPGQTARWESMRRRVQAVFLLELASHGQTHAYRYWADVLDLARRFVMSRPEDPGINIDDDRFELLWHQTAFAILSASQRPELIENCGVTPLLARISAEPTGWPTIIDPWIELATGISDEFWTIFEPTNLGARAPQAMRNFDAASAHPATRAEARVRLARLLGRLGRFREAAAVLDTAETGRSDVYVRYWREVLRGASLAELADDNAAARAYEAALQLAPGAQSGLLGLMALAVTREALVEANSRASEIRAPRNSPDPWWEYGYGDRRFLEQRLSRLREMSR